MSFEIELQFEDQPWQKLVPVFEATLEIPIRLNGSCASALQNFLNYDQIVVFWNFRLKYKKKRIYSPVGVQNARALQQLNIVNMRLLKLYRVNLENISENLTSRK